MTKVELVKEMLKMAGRKGAAISNMKQWGKTHNTRKNTGYAFDVDGRKIRTKRYWFNDGNIEGQYSLTDYPQSWTRGRLRSVMNKVNKNVIL